MRFRIFPPVTEIRFIGIHNAESTLMKKPQYLWWLTIMLVHFRAAAGETVKRVKKRMIERKLLKLLLRKNSTHLIAEVLIEAIVIISMQEPTSTQVFAQT